jgi:prepilin-type N-terminal cleavage/methylation domain-containing protein
MRAAFTLVELLVVIAIIGVMVGLLLPAVQAAREAARKMSCSNHERQLGLAIHNYHSAYDRFPSGWIADEPEDEPGWSWGAAILPFIEQQAIYEKIDFSVAIEEAQHEPARLHVISTFLCPSDVGPDLFAITESDTAHHHGHSHALQAPADPDDHEHGNVDEGEDKLFTIAKANYVGVYGTEEVELDPFHGDGTFFGNSKIRFRDFLDGTSTTIMLGERTTELGSSIWHGVIPEAAAAEARIVGSTDHAPNDAIRHFEDFSSHHNGGAFFTMADGSVRFVTQFIEMNVYRGLATRHNHEVIEADAY